MEVLASQLHKEIAKEEVKEEIQDTTQDMNTLTETVVPKDVSADAGHNIHDAVRVRILADKGIDKLASRMCGGFQLKPLPLPTTLTTSVPRGVSGDVRRATVDRVCGLSRKQYLCDRCDKNFANHRSLWGHKKRGCRIEPTILRWNGKSWETSKNMHYRINLGRDLSSLLERGAIKEEALNSTQRKYIQMYKSLFQADDS